jgi:DNA ligase-1
MTEWQRWKNIMKAMPFEEKRLAKWEPPYLVQPKYDGVRCRAVPTASGYLLFSSEENVIFSVPHLNDILNSSFNSTPYWETLPELDGELYCHGMKFEEIVSITSRTVNLHEDYTRISYHCFDVINEEIQIRRLSFINKLKDKSEWIKIAPVHICYNLDEVLKAYDSILESGYEGIIVRHWQAPYERKRSTLVMKFKPKQQDNYEICGFQEEVDKEGTPKDTLGALTCKSGDGNIFNVGTGFSGDRRKQLWEGRDLLIGQIATVKYQHITSGKQVPRFPVFVEVKVKV